MSPNAERFAVRLKAPLVQAPCIMLVAVFLLGGCDPKTDWYRWLNPSDTIKTPSKGRAPVMPIMPTLVPAEYDEELPPNYTLPKEGDWSYTNKDYLIGPRDIIDISVLDLYAEGQETILRRQVSDSGFVDLPLLPELVKAEGHTQDQLTQLIVNSYSPDILRHPVVSVTIQARRQGTFSVLGGVQRPGTYEIVRKDMRLLDALALPGGIMTTNIKYMWVIRPEPIVPTVVAMEKIGPKTAPSEIELPALPGETPSTSSGRSKRRSRDWRCRTPAPKK